MTRRELLVGSAAALGALGASDRRDRPNVLILMSDQHKRSCMGAYGDRVARTPNLDALARNSVRFTDAYCSNPVCTPSRASLLTGLYTHNHGSLNNSTPLPIEHKTMAHHFARAGYVTGLVGKMHFVDAQTHGFDYRLDFNDWYQYLGPKTKLYADELSRANSGSGLPQIDDLWRDFGDPWKDDRELDDREGSGGRGTASRRSPSGTTSKVLWPASQCGFCRNTASKNNRSCLICSFLKPHDPFMPAARFASMFRPEDMKLAGYMGQGRSEKGCRKRFANRSRTTRPTPELAKPRKRR